MVYHFFHVMSDWVIGVVDFIRNNCASDESLLGCLPTASSCLEKNGFSYDANKFPEVDYSAIAKGCSTDRPSTLAEAMIWKLGRWSAYVRFRKNFQAASPEPTSTDVVLFAFSKHLKDPDNNPIYDQHVVRALWAITREKGMKHKLQSLLFHQNGKWKESSSGKTAICCYHWYVNTLRGLLGASKNQRTLSQLYTAS